MQASSEDIRRLAGAVTFLVEGAYRGMSRTFDITRFGLLRLAASGSPVRPSEVADALNVNPSTVTRYVRALEDDGYVLVMGNPADARSCLISITEKGKAELERHDDAGANVFAAVIHDWSAEDVRQFADLINRLASAWMKSGPVQSRPHRRAAAPRWRTTTGGSHRD